MLKSNPNLTRASHTNNSDMSQDEKVTLLPALLSILSNPVRAKLIHEVDRKSAAQIAVELKKKQPALSPHLRELLEAGLITWNTKKRGYETTERGRRLRDKLDQLIPIAVEIHQYRESRKNYLRQLSPQAKKEIVRFGSGLTPKDIVEILREVAEKG